MKKYTIYYDFCDTTVTYGLKEEADTREEANQIAAELKASPEYSNIQIVENNVEEDDK